MDKKKIINIIEICFWLLAVVLLIIFLYIKFAPASELKKENVIKENGRIFLQEVINDYEITKKSQYDIEKNIQGVIKKLNKERTNPYDKKQNPYVIDEECLGCITINIDEGVGNVVMTGYDKRKHILTRSVIKPPSYVTYEKPSEK